MSVSPRIPQEQETATPGPATARPRRTWPRKFGDAFRGLKRGIRGQSSFSVHLFFAALVVAAGIVLQCSLEQWGLLLICIGLVFSAELFNSAIETLFRGLDEETRERAWPCLDIAAGAVLVACIAAAVVGSLVFLGRLAEICKLFLDA
jgi:diacylglycerol kinase